MSILVTIIFALHTAIGKLFLAATMDAYSSNVLSAGSPSVDLIVHGEGRGSRIESGVSPSWSASRDRFTDSMVETVLA